MLFFMSGKVGSTGYSFFSGVEYEWISFTFVLLGEESKSEEDNTGLYSEEGDTGGEL